MEFLQIEYFNMPLIFWICLLIVVGYIVWLYLNREKKSIENFGRCGGMKVVKKEPKNKIKTKNKIKITCFYSNSCHFSKVFMGPIIEGSQFQGEWKDIKHYCKRNGIDVESKECDNNPLHRALATRMGVPGFPSCVVSIEDEVVHTIVGAKKSKDFINEIKQVKHGKKVKKNNNIPSKGLAIRTYYADWCIYSKMLMGVKIIPTAIDKDGNPMKGEWDQISAFCKDNNIDCKYVETSSGAGQEEARSLGIRGFPTTKIYKDGKEVDEIGGFMEAPGFIEMINKNLHGKKEEMKQEKKGGSSGLTVKAYYADWCIYSKMLMGIKIIPGAKDKDGNPIKGEWEAIDAFCKENNINCEYIETSDGAGKEEARSLGIRGFPTTKILKNGKEVDEIGGFIEAPGFIAMIKKNM